MAKSEMQKVVSAPVATIDNDMFAADAGAGMEGADKDSFAIPFLSVLQKGSPQVDEASGVAIEGAKAGMLFENVTGTMIDGKTGVQIVPCSYRRVYVHWGARSTGGSFKGELTPETVVAMRESGKIVELEGRLYMPAADGTVHPERCDRISDTRNHYVLVLRPEGGWTEALLSLSSTQIKKSKHLMSALSAVKFQGANGLFSPPSFANVVRATTMPESNDKGTWFGIKFVIEGKVSSPEIYAAARAFHASVSTGNVVAKYEAPVGEESAGGDRF